MPFDLRSSAQSVSLVANQMNAGETFAIFEQNRLNEQWRGDLDDERDFWLENRFGTLRPTHTATRSGLESDQRSHN